MKVPVQKGKIEAVQPTYKWTTRPRVDAEDAQNRSMRRYAQTMEKKEPKK